MKDVIIIVTDSVSCPTPAGETHQVYTRVYQYSFRGDFRDWDKTLARFELDPDVAEGGLMRLNIADYTKVG